MVGLIVYSYPEHKVFFINDMALDLFGWKTQEDFDNFEEVQRVFKDPEKTIERLRAIKNPGDYAAYEFCLIGGVENIGIEAKSKMIEMDGGRYIVSSFYRK